MTGTPSRRPAVLLGAFQLEANSFVPDRTSLADLRRQTWAAGDDVGPDVLGHGSEVAGAWAALVEAGVRVVPALVASASPGGPLTAEASRAVREGMLARADGAGGALLVLHGSAVADGDDDPEGTLLTALRARLGPGRPIVITLDHHAHLTPRMLAAVDAVTAYRTCPHIDLRERGEQAGRILAAALAGRVRPTPAMASRPMITPADTHDSSRPPFSTLMAGCLRAERDGALAAGLLTVQPWIDVPGLGWKAVVTTDDDPARARELAERLIGDAWSVRHQMVPESRPSIGEALEMALGLPAPVVIADAGDATNGGAPGDSTELLRAVLARGDHPRVLLSVRDASAARAACAAGPGAEVALVLGAGRPGSFNARTVLAGTVTRTGGGPIAYSHPAAPAADDLGEAAMVVSAGTSVVVHERAVRVIDPTIYLALGADPSAAQVVQAKSQVSYRLGFAALTARSIVADTPGPTSARLERLVYRRRPRPLFPFEDAEG